MKPDALRGHLGSLILAVVEHAPVHGYGIAETLQQRTEGVIDLPTGTLYPALRRLERKGLLRSTWSLANGRRRRTYEITPSGAASLAADREEFEQFTKTVSAVLRRPVS